MLHIEKPHLGVRYTALLLMATCTASSIADEHQYELSVEKARAPITLIGTSVKDWVLFFEADYDYTIEKISNIHTGEPAALVTLRKDETTAKLFIDLVAGRQFLLSVESTSDDFLNRMYLQSTSLDEGERFFCGEDGYDCVRLKQIGDYGRKATWNFYFD